MRDRYDPVLEPIMESGFIGYNVTIKKNGVPIHEMRVKGDQRAAEKAAHDWIEQYLNVHGRPPQ